MACDAVSLACPFPALLGFVLVLAIVCLCLCLCLCVCVCVISSAALRFLPFASFFLCVCVRVRGPRPLALHPSPLFFVSNLPSITTGASFFSTAVCAAHASLRRRTVQFRSLRVCLCEVRVCRNARRRSAFSCPSPAACRRMTGSLSMQPGSGILSPPSAEKTRSMRFNETTDGCGEETWEFARMPQSGWAVSFRAASSLGTFHRGRDHGTFFGWCLGLRKWPSSARTPLP